MKLFEKSIHRLMRLSFRVPKEDREQEQENLQKQKSFKDAPRDIVLETAVFSRGINYDEIEEKSEHLRRRKVISLQE